MQQHAWIMSCWLLLTIARSTRSAQRASFIWKQEICTVGLRALTGQPVMALHCRFAFKLELQLHFKERAYSTVRLQQLMHNTCMHLLSAPIFLICSCVFGIDHEQACTAGMECAENSLQCFFCNGILLGNRCGPKIDSGPCCLH